MCVWMTRSFAQGRLTYDNSHRVEVVKKIVGQTLRLHTSSKGIGGGTQGTVVDLPDGLEQKDTTGLERAADIVDKVVIVTEGSGATSSNKNARAGMVPEAFAADAHPASAC